MNISGIEPEILSPPLALQDVWQGNLGAPGRGEWRWTVSILFTSGLFSLGGRKQKLWMSRQEKCLSLKKALSFSGSTSAHLKLHVRSQGEDCQDAWILSFTQGRLFSDSEFSYIWKQKSLILKDI